MNESDVRNLCYDICLRNFGENNLTTKMAKSNYIPNPGPRKGIPYDIEYVTGIDRKNTDYIN